MATRLQSFPREVTAVIDVLYIGLTAALVGLSWGIVRLCDRV
jgi:hypothetical protein